MARFFIWVAILAGSRHMLAMSDTAVPETPPDPQPEPQYRRRTWSDLLPRFDAETWPMWIVVALCAGAFALQMTRPDFGTEFAFSPADFHGRVWTFATSIFLHGGIVHIASNMYSYISLAPLVILRFGGGTKAILPYHAFYLLCGLAGNAVFWMMHPHSEVSVLGASGAVYGVFGAVMRLDPRSHELFPIVSRRTLQSLWTFLWTNVVVIVIFGGPSMLLQIFSGQALQIPIAWEAHLGGYVAGFFLIQLMAGRGWPQALEQSRQP